MSDNSTHVLAGGGGRLARLQPGVIGWMYIHYRDNAEFSQWYENGVQLDSHRVDERTVKLSEKTLATE